LNIFLNEINITKGKYHYMEIVQISKHKYKNYQIFFLSSQKKKKNRTFSQGNIKNRLSSITNVAPSRSAYQIAVYTSNENYFLINHFIH
jgi:hypothetical protein